LDKNGKNAISICFIPHRGSYARLRECPDIAPGNHNLKVKKSRVDILSTKQKRAIEIADAK